MERLGDQRRPILGYSGSNLLHIYSNVSDNLSVIGLELNFFTENRQNSANGMTHS